MLLPKTEKFMCDSTSVKTIALPWTPKVKSARHKFNISLLECIVNNSLVLQDKMQSGKRKAWQKYKDSQSLCS